MAEASILHDGGKLPELMAVQGGGGGYPTNNSEESLLGGDADLAPINGVQGGGQLPGAGAGAGAAAGVINPLETLFALIPNEIKQELVKKVTAIILVSNEQGLSDQQTSEIVVQSVAGTVQDHMTKAYGIPMINDPKVQVLYSNGTPGEREVIEKALNANRSNPGKAAEDSLTAIDEYRKKRKVDPIIGVKSKLQGKIIKYTASRDTLDKINDLKDVDIHRIEYITSPIQPIDKASDDYKTDIMIWMTTVDVRVRRFFPAIVRKNIEICKKEWEQATLKSITKGIEPSVTKAVIENYLNSTATNKISPVQNISSYTVCLPYSTQSIITIPPIRGDVQKLQDILLNLQALNVITYTRGDQKNAWKIAENSVIVFSHPFYDYKTFDFEKNKRLFAYIHDIQMNNMNKIYCLSDGGSDDLLKVGLQICNCYNKDSDNWTKINGANNYYIPTLLSPTNILFPYRLNQLSGIIISGEEERSMTTEINPFANIYASANYGKLYGIHMRRGYPFSEAEPRICAVRMGRALETLKKQAADVKSVKNMRFPLKEEIEHVVNASNQSGGGEECIALRVIDDGKSRRVRTRTLDIFDKELFITKDICILTRREDYGKCFPEIKNEVFGQDGGKQFKEHKEKYEISDPFDTVTIDVNGIFFEIRSSVTNESLRKNWAGEGKNNVNPYDVPVLIKGEADLLNSLELTPKNMGNIFNRNNGHGLTDWRKAIPMFFSNILSFKCYKDVSLLTNAECEITRKFLYSIQEYTDNPANFDEIVEDSLLVKQNHFPGKIHHKLKGGQVEEGDVSAKADDYAPSAAAIISETVALPPASTEYAVESSFLFLSLFLDVSGGNTYTLQQVEYDENDNEIVTSLHPQNDKANAEDKSYIYRWGSYIVKFANTNHNMEYLLYMFSASVTK